MFLEIPALEGTCDFEGRVQCFLGDFGRFLLRFGGNINPALLYCLDFCCFWSPFMVWHLLQAFLEFSLLGVLLLPLAENSTSDWTPVGPFGRTA